MSFLIDSLRVNFGLFWVCFCEVELCSRMTIFWISFYAFQWERILPACFSKPSKIASRICEGKSGGSHCSTLWITSAVTKSWRRTAYFGLSGHLFRFHLARRFGVIRPAWSDLRLSSLFTRLLHPEPVFFYVVTHLLIPVGGIVDHSV